MKFYKRNTNASNPVLKITPSNKLGEMISFVNRNSRIDIYVYSSGRDIAISKKNNYGEGYEVTNDADSIYINVGATTSNFVSSSIDCSVEVIGSIPD